MTKNLFDFNLQLFDLPKTPTVSASENNIVIEGSDTVIGGSSDVAVTDAEILDAIAALYAPNEGDEQELNDIAYTFDGENWDYETTTAVTASEEIASAILAANFEPSDGDTQTYEGITYTFDAADKKWNYEQEITQVLEDSDTINALAALYAPTEGQEVTLEDITYTYDGENWNYEITENAVATDEQAEAVFDAYLAENLSEGDTQELNDITYTYDGDNWTYETDATETAAAEIVAQIVDEYYSPSEGDEQEYDSISYTFDGTNWTYETDATETAAAEIVAQIVDEYYSPSEGDSQEYDSISYTFDGTNWTYETDATETAAAEIVAQIVDEYYTPDEGDSQEYDSIYYTYSDGAWSYLETVTQDASEDQSSDAIAAYIAANLTEGDTVDFDGETYTFDGSDWLDENDTAVGEEVVAGIEAQYLTDNLSDGDTADVDGTTYTYDGAEWTYEEEVTAYATAEIADAIIDEYYSADEGDTQDIDNITYTFDGSDWTYETETTETAAAEIADAIIDEYYSADEGDTQDIEGITYTYTDGEWLYETTVTEIASAEIVDAIIDEYYSADEGDTQEIEGITYTYTDGEWLYETTVAEIADEATQSAIIAEYYTPSEGDTVDVDGVTYTCTDGAWTFESVTTDTADSDTAAAILETLEPEDGETQDIDGITYTYDDEDDDWSYETTTTVSAEEAAALAIILENYAPDEGAVVEYEGVSYTAHIDADADAPISFTFDETSDETADSDTVAAIIAEYYTPDEGETRDIDDITYTFDGESWTHEVEVTLTSYYQFSDSISSPDTPVSIQQTVTSGDLENTSISSPVIIAGTGDDFAVKGVGTVSGLDEDETFAVIADDSNINYVALIGDVELTAEGKKVNLGVGNASLSYSTNEKGEPVTIAAENPSWITAHADVAVTLNSIDDMQQWILNEDADAALNFRNVAYTAIGDEVAVYSAGDSILSADLDDGESLIISKDGSGRTDVVRVNGATISSAAKAGGDTSSTITAEEENLIITAGANGGNVTVNGDIIALAASLSATIEGTGSEAAVTAVDALGPKGKWVTDQTEVTIDDQIWTNNSGGAVTLTADADCGTSVAKINFNSGTVALNAEDDAEATVNVNGKAEWILEGTDDKFEDFAAFDANGNVTLAGSDKDVNTAVLHSGKNVLLTAGNTGDVLTVSKDSTVTATGDDAVEANSLAAGGAWTVKAENAILGDYDLTIEEADSDGTRAIITADKSKGNVISSIQGLSGNATLDYGSEASINGLTVGNATWSIKNAAADGNDISTAIFSAEGNVTVEAASDSTLEVSGVSNADCGTAVVNITNGFANSKLNGVEVFYIGDDNGGIDFELEEKAHNAGVAAISGVDEGTTLQVSGDTLYTVNQFTYANSARDDADLTVSENSLSLHGTKNGDVVTITGGSGSVHFAEAEKANAAVTVNGVGVSIDAAKADYIDDVIIYTSDNGKIDLIVGDATTTTINTNGDDKFTVRYDSPDSDTDEVTLNVNDIKVQIGEGAEYDTNTFSLSVDGSNVVLTGISFNADDTLTVSGGSYKIGKSAAVSVTETLGYITFDKHGNATAVEKSVKDNEDAREGAIDSVKADALLNPAPVLELYQKLGTEDSGAPSSDVAGYEDAEDSDASTSSVEGGINIYGNAALDSEDLTAVTLQSFTDDDIVVFEAEDSSIRESVIDVSQGKASVVAIDPLTDTTGVNHTVIGGNNGNYIKFGANARGNNYAQAGSVGSYLANEGGDATLTGGAGNDSIAAKKGDKVTGGAGADYFFDANGAYLVSDYDASQGDVLVATKLADINKNLDAETLTSKIAVKGNTINIAGGGKFTLGGNASSDATVSALNVRFTDSNAQDIHNLTWAPSDGGNVDASAFSEGSVLMVADQNGGASDSVVGSSGNDTIFVGGNDTVNAGAGKDEIYIKAANSAKKEEGAVIQLSGGRTYVHNWNFGFDNAKGANILETDAGNLTFDNKEDTLIAFNSTDTIYFVDNDSETEVFDILTGSPDENKKVSLIRSSKNVVVSSDDDVADYYYAAADVNATITFAEGVGDISDTISMGGGSSYNTSSRNNFINIHNMVLTNNGAATLVGTGDKDVLQLGGTTDSDAQKHVSLGGGNDSVISGGTNTSVAGNTFYFGLENDGSDIINNFGYYQGNAADADKAAADKIILYNWDEGGASRITANGNNIEIKVNDASKITIQESGGIDANNKILYQLGYDGEERVAQVGQTSGAKNNFTYDKETFVYVGNTEANQDTLSVAASDDNVAVWLDGHHGTVYEGIGVIDASASTNTQLSLAGGVGNNTICGGGEGAASSLWGGGYGNNELIGGDGNDVFFFTKCGSNDTISNFDAANDRIRLGDITLDDLIEGQTYFDGDDVKIQLKAESGGGVLTIKNANGAQVEVNKGDGSYQAYTASTSDQSWS